MQLKWPIGLGVVGFLAWVFFGDSGFWGAINSAGGGWVFLAKAPLALVKIACLLAPLVIPPVMASRGLLRPVRWAQVAAACSAVALACFLAFEEPPIGQAEKWDGLIAFVVVPGVLSAFGFFGCVVAALIHPAGGPMASRQVKA